MTFAVFAPPVGWGRSPDYRHVTHATGQAVAKPTTKGVGFEASRRHFGENFDTSTHAAVIKMMMATFGSSPKDMFAQFVPVAGGYAITMKDEFKVVISQHELEQTRRASRFTGADSGAVDSANVALTAYVKRKQVMGGYHTFDGALADTLQGETTLRCLRGMGLYGLSQYVPTHQMVGDGVAGVLETHTRGSAFVLDGVRHDYTERRRVDRGYGYRLFNDKTPLEKASANRNNTVVSQMPVGMKPRNIWSGFYQGAEGNCVTISAIKAAMMKFGQNPAGIYKNISAVSGGFEVIMRDGFKLFLSHEERRKAEQGSNLDGSDQALKDDANFLYAVSAKRAQLENNDMRAGRSFEDAMHSLNDGEAPGQALRRLGLIAHVRQSTAQELAKGAIGTLADNMHSVLAVSGSVDNYGQKLGLTSSGWSDRTMWALKLV
ncbi:hypothetical protein BLL37_05205 [Pseudomonas azotoformans]|uniref:Uncharacterized protein n=1 Tax=Pseudomonas azotoformans TaxID=47878 RepID=A0A1V2JTD7_PSEAZ|nr:hypothetical protein [Pseudomonas azotoformans]OIN52413.1 hypothetical protein BFL39_03785 [Pseudomonas azotoformans]ONH48762.1 hypothetical protein BLL37_05205 [Pseudomonas azotoformans]SDN58068.1 hypothetical protein SAMN04489799_2323 [Pseudomonas azotoformans]